MGAWQPKTGAKCPCRRGVQCDNCSACEGTGWVIDFAAIRARFNPPVQKVLTVTDLERMTANKQRSI